MREGAGPRVAADRSVEQLLCSENVVEAHHVDARLPQLTDGGDAFYEGNALADVVVQQGVVEKRSVAGVVGHPEQDLLTIAVFQVPSGQFL